MATHDAGSRSVAGCCAGGTIRIGPSHRRKLFGARSATCAASASRSKKIVRQPAQCRRTGSFGARGKLQRDRATMVGGTVDAGRDGVGQMGERGFPTGTVQRFLGIAPAHSQGGGGSLGAATYLATSFWPIPSDCAAHGMTKSGGPMLT